MKVIAANSAFEVAYQDIVALVRKHADAMTALELLAIAANMCGKLAALQDQRTVTPDMALEVIAKNVEIGNAQACGEVSNSKGSA